MSVLTHATVFTQATTREPEAVARVVSHVVAQLRTQGQRVTTARRAVIEALARTDAHPSVDQLWADIEPRFPGVHRSTVYRTVETLAELGAINHVHLGHGTTTYHLSGPIAGQDHLHVQCRVCGRVIDLPTDALESVRVRLDDEVGFALDPRHVALSGTCRTCRTP